MLNRRYIRVKVFQALYAWFQSHSKDITGAEKELFKSLDKIYDLYLYILLLLVELAHAASLSAERTKNRKFLSRDFGADAHFSENYLFTKLASDKVLLKEAEKRRLNWSNDQETVRKLLRLIQQTKTYQSLSSPDTLTPANEKKIVTELYTDFIAEEGLLLNHMEEKNIHWSDDIALVNMAILKTLANIGKVKEGASALLPLFNDEQDDKRFVHDLFIKTIQNNSEYEKLISQKAENWDSERIALSDMILMKLALCELLYFPTIPVKVSLNEYIELSKYYSTPKSKLFINGIMDKIVADLRTQEKIQKEGRGMVEK